MSGSGSTVAMAAVPPAPPQYLKQLTTLVHRASGQPWATTGREHMQQTMGQRGYSITSSARESISGGTTTPTALAVLRLMISSKVVGCPFSWATSTCASSRNARRRSVSDGAGNALARHARIDILAAVAPKPSVDPRGRRMRSTRLLCNISVPRMAVTGQSRRIERGAATSG
jgi:hypothetical protein